MSPIGFRVLLFRFCRAAITLDSEFNFAPLSGCIGVAPSGRTTRFYVTKPPAGRLCFEFLGWVVAEGRVQSFDIVDLPDEYRQTAGDIGEDCIASDIDFFDLQCFRETLDLGVVAGIADVAHGTAQDCKAEGIAIEPGCVWAAPVRGMDASRQRHFSRDG